MGDNGEKQRAAAKCETCGKIGIVRICPDGQLEPVGGPTLCECTDPDLHILDNSDAL